MGAQKSKKRHFHQMSYREVQRANSERRKKLRKEDQQWLKENNFKNVGWDNIVPLYQKIEEFLERYQLEDLTLEDLFLEADRVGNKYLTHQEIEEFNQQLAKEINEVEEEFDRQFPDTEVEVIDFGGKPARRSYKSSKKSKR